MEERNNETETAFSVYLSKMKLEIEQIFVKEG